MIRNIISASDLSPAELQKLFERADHYRTTRMLKKFPLRRMIGVTCFYQPSMRTRFSFESAILRLGGQYIGTEAAGMFSSAIKGESIEDSTRIMAGYGDFIVLRSENAGDAAKAAAVSTVPIINAGDGTGEHPTQAFLDLYTIEKHFGRGKEITVTFVGDLKRGRTVHSLIKLLAAMHEKLVRVREIICVAPPELQLPDEIFADAQHIGTISRVHWLSPEILGLTDIIYMTRTQREYGQVEFDPSAFTLTPERAQMLPETSIILHPLPRNDELPPAIDFDPRARYFGQAQNGLYVRMALLEMLMKK